eukprot:TRINITY_DN28309_c0_g1_i1.p1 TRINITY_DN28309_c0_g1~~TRINITY_DN28309_c0_g1_i1.p1  ORF type:complete len:311 (+),score=129.92 TRINITY_DN28309_c0_g1_i1:30-935(+)
MPDTESLPWAGRAAVWLDAAAREWVGPEFFVCCCAASMLALAVLVLYMRREEPEEEESAKGAEPERRHDGLSLAALTDLNTRAKRLELEGDARGALSLHLAVLYDTAGGDDGVAHGGAGAESLPRVCTDSLHRAAVLSRDLGHAELAIRLLQAEKFLYENALLDYAKGAGPAVMGQYADLISGALQTGDATDRRCGCLMELALLFLSRGEAFAALNYAIKAYALRLRANGVEDEDAQSACSAMEDARASGAGAREALAAVLRATTDDPDAVAEGRQAAPSEFAVLKRCYAAASRGKRVLEA